MNFFKIAKKSLGQNFLIDQNIINKIIKIGKITENKTVLEIGPGNGNLTRKIANMKPKKILAIEKDRKLVLFLKNIFKDFKNIKIINNDIFNIIENKNLGQDTIVFGNLPYNISTQILASLVLLEKWPPWYEILIFMFQKEVADRILAKKNIKDFGRLSILCNWRLDIKKHFDVSKNLKREMNLSQAGDALIDTTVKTANGRITCAEALGHKEFVITKLYRSA